MTPDRARLAPSLPLPEVPYRPGQGVHPARREAAGPELESGWPPEGGWATWLPDLYAIDLFHHAAWWEAHERWESLWHQAGKDSAERLVLQALIQCAASELKAAMGEPTPARTPRRRALAKLEGVEGRIVCAMDLPLLRDRMRSGQPVRLPFCAE